MNIWKVIVWKGPAVVGLFDVLGHVNDYHDAAQAGLRAMPPEAEATHASVALRMAPKVDMSTL